MEKPAEIHEKGLRYIWKKTNLFDRNSKNQNISLSLSHFCSITNNWNKSNELQLKTSRHLLNAKQFFSWYYFFSNQSAKVPFHGLFLSCMCCKYLFIDSECVLYENGIEEKHHLNIYVAPSFERNSLYHCKSLHSRPSTVFVLKLLQQ